MVLLLEPGYDSTQTNPLAQAKRQWILQDWKKRVDAGYDRGHCECWFCNRRKSSDIGAIDPDSGQFVRLFDPRQQEWSDHFEFVSTTIVGVTPESRATVEFLQLNSPERLQERSELIRLGRL